MKVLPIKEHTLLEHSNLKKGIDNLSLSYLVIKLDTIFQWKFIFIGISVDIISQIWIKRVR